MYSFFLLRSLTPSVSPAVGALFPEPEDKYDWEAVSKGIYNEVMIAFKEDWKTVKGEACWALVKDKYSVLSQCINVLKGVDSLVL